LSKTTRREFLKIGLAAAGGALAASGLEIPLFGGNTSSLQNQITNLNKHINTVTGFLTLSIPEQQLLEPVVETIIPSDSTGPGAKEAGVIYFIDRQLASDYGQSGNMFMDAPHIRPNMPANSATPLTVRPSSAWAFLQNKETGAYLPAGGMGNGAAKSYPGNASQMFTAGGTTYTVNYGITGSTGSPRVGSGINYQYPINMREFWRVSLAALQSYSNKVYAGNFQTLSSDNQLNVLKDLWNNVPKTKSPPADDLTGFSNIQASDFAYELTFMTWAGFLMDPIYGGNKDMVGWDYTGFNGVNFGNFYGEGLSQKTLMVASNPTKLKPASLAQYQQQATGGT